MKASEKPLIVAPAAADEFAKAFYALGVEVTESLRRMADVMEPLAPAKNLPRDPSMRKDRRKWGGR